ncbi:MAG: hypothetical protein ACLTSX_13960 [Collinsella sp.]
MLVAGRVDRRPAGARLARRHPPLPGRRVAAPRRAPDAQSRRNAPTRQKKDAVLGILKAVFAERDPELVRKLHQTRHRPD